MKIKVEGLAIKVIPENDEDEDRLKTFLWLCESNEITPGDALCKFLDLVDSTDGGCLLMEVSA